MRYEEQELNLDTPFWYFNWTDCHCSNECEDECTLPYDDAVMFAIDAYSASFQSAEGEARWALRGTGLEDAETVYGVQWTQGRATNRHGDDDTYAFSNKSLSRVLDDLATAASPYESIGLYFDGSAIVACGETVECAVLFNKTQYDILCHWAIEPLDQINRWCVEGSPLLDAVYELSEIEGRVVLSLLSELNDGTSEVEDLEDEQRLLILKQAIDAMRVVHELGGVFAEAVLTVLAG
jgi:hypothetical protein